jgi:glycosyltransferase involved in cell wall biosynthesis
VYHKRPAIASTVFDIARGVERCLRFAGPQRPRLYHARATVPAAIAYSTTRLRSAPFLNDSDGILSEEYVDARVWRRGSIGHRLTAALEWRALEAADSIVVLTERRRAQLVQEGFAPPHVIPCAVDTDHFRHDAHARARIRNQLGLQGRVFVYVGKSGGWYCTAAMLDFVAAARVIDPNVTMLVVTNEPPAGFASATARLGIPCVVRSATRPEMPSLLSAADVGLSFVLPAPSKAASSPVKNGEYLACGLPVVTTAGIGDYSSLIEQRRVGVVVDALNAPAYRRAVLELDRLRMDPSLAVRCREVAEAELSVTGVAIPQYIKLYERLLGPAGTSPA